MSLFKVRELWSTTCGHDEHFECESVCLSNIDNDTNGADKIIVGSLEGVLRIFLPRISFSEEGTPLGFRPDDSLLEAQLNFPILQLKAGRFSGVKETLSLAVLHPKKVSVYTVTATSGAVDHGSHYRLSLLYEHNLNRSAYCLVTGPFGKITGKDFLCVQSLDGSLSFYEHDSFAFTRFLPGFLLPGPLTFCVRTDSFITLSSAWALESYKYQVLAVAIETTKGDERGDVRGKRVVCDWSASLGENALDIKSNSDLNLIFVLGERNLFCFKDTGMLNFVKKMDHTTICFYPYSIPDGPPCLLEVTENSYLMVYQGVSLRWAAQLSFAPIFVTRTKLQDLEGVLLFLSDDGQLACAYLGTNPVLFVPPTVESRRINYTETDKEMMQLQKIIKGSQKTKFSSKLQNEIDLAVNISVSKHLDMIPVEDFDPEINLVPSVSLQIELKSVQIVNDVHIAVHVAKPLVAKQTVFSYPTITNYVHTSTSVHLSHNHMPSDLCARIVTTFNNHSGVPQVSVSVVYLPLSLVIKSAPPVKEAVHKITLNTNRPAISLAELFPEFSDDSNSTSQAIGFEYLAGPVVTLLAAKTSQRYRLQSDCFASLWLVSWDLINRLKEQFTGDSSTLFSYSSNIPLTELFSILDKHFELRMAAQRLEDQLGQRAAQFRAIQRRLLVKFKNKTPTPLDNLDMLLEGTYRQVLSLISEVEKIERELESSSSELCCGLRFTTLLLRLLTGINETEAELLDAVIGEVDSENTEQGWEESVDAAITHLLHTSLSKTGKDQVKSGNSMLGLLKDVSRLKKHVTLMVDRVSKGGRLQSKEGDAESLQPTPLLDDEDKLPEGDAINPLVPQMTSRAPSAAKENVDGSRPITASSSGADSQTGAPEIVTSTYEEADDVIAF